MVKKCKQNWTRCAPHNKKALVYNKLTKYRADFVLYTQNTEKWYTLENLRASTKSGMSTKRPADAYFRTCCIQLVTYPYHSSSQLFRNLRKLEDGKINEAARKTSGERARDIFHFRIILDGELIRASQVKLSSPTRLIESSIIRKTSELHLRSNK